MTEHAIAAPVLAAEQSRSSPRLHPLAGFSWTIAAFAAIAAGIEGFVDWRAAQSAPQQAAAMAFALFLAVVPYVFARAVQEITRP